MPVIATRVPIGPAGGARLAIVGVGKTVNATPLLATPFTVTTTFPLVAAAGTGTLIVVPFQLFGVAGVPLKVTVLVPCVAPKVVPVIVTTVPAAPESGDRLVITGAAVTVNVFELLAVPPTVTRTGPVVAPVGTGTEMLVVLQLVGVAAVPLKATVLLPCIEPKLVPAIVTEAVTAPEVGVRLTMVGAATNAIPLLGTPFTVTTTFPVSTPAGAGTTILVALQLVGVAASPSNVTELVPCVAPKRLPLIVTDVPDFPEVGEILVMIGADVFVNRIPLLRSVSTSTTTGPVPAPAGTGATMVVAFQLVGVASTPSKVTVLVPWLEPKFVPAIVTAVPATPEVGAMLVRVGAMAV